MRKIIFTTVILAAGLAASVADAACSGSNGRGWGSGKGKGEYTMTSADAGCDIDFPGFIDDAAQTRTPATEVTLTTPPKNGKITLSKTGVIYTPNAGFTGKDKFCTRNTTPLVKGKKLSGCVTVIVN